MPPIYAGRPSVCKHLPKPCQTTTVEPTAQDRRVTPCPQVWFVVGLRPGVVTSGSSEIWKSWEEFRVPQQTLPKRYQELRMTQIYDSQPAIWNHNHVLCKCVLCAEGLNRKPKLIQEAAGHVRAYHVEVQVHCHIEM